MVANEYLVHEMNAIFRKRRQRRIIRAIAVLLALVVLYFTFLYSFAAVRLAQAKNQGVYPTAVEAARETWSQGFGGAEVEQVSMRSCGPNNPQDNPNDRNVVVWFCTAMVKYDRNPQGYDRSEFLAGDFFVRVKDGWVYMGEGKFPGIVGGIMNFYHMEGIP